MPVQGLIRLDYVNSVLSIRGFGNSSGVHVYTNAINRGFSSG